MHSAFRLAGARATLGRPLAGRRRSAVRGPTADRRSPAAIVVGGVVDPSPLLGGRDRAAGAELLVCRGRVCDLPVTLPRAGPADLPVAALPGMPMPTMRAMIPRHRLALPRHVECDISPRPTALSLIAGPRTRSSVADVPSSGSGRRDHTARRSADYAELVSLRVSGNEAAFQFRLTVAAGDNRMRIEPIDVMAFDDDGKVTAMKAYWSPE